MTKSPAKFFHFAFSSVFLEILGYFLVHDLDLLLKYWELLSSDMFSEDK